MYVFLWTGGDVVKPYTPVDQVLMPQIHSSNTLSSEIYLMIKVYPDGVFTQHLGSLDIGVWICVHVCVIFVVCVCC